MFSHGDACRAHRRVWVTVGVGQGGCGRCAWVGADRGAHTLIPLWQGDPSLKASSRLPCHGGVGGWSAILNPEKVLVLKDLNPLSAAAEKTSHMTGFLNAHLWRGFETSVA